MLQLQHTPSVTAATHSALQLQHNPSVTTSKYTLCFRAATHSVYQKVGMPGAQAATVGLHRLTWLALTCSRATRSTPECSRSRHSGSSWRTCRRRSCCRCRPPCSCTGASRRLAAGSCRRSGRTRRTGPARTDRPRSRPGTCNSAVRVGGANYEPSRVSHRGYVCGWIKVLTDTGERS